MTSPVTWPPPYPLAVYVPARDRLRTINPRSGIVGTPAATRYAASSTDQVVIDFQGEGPSVNIRTWADRVHHAAGRHVWGLDPGRPFGGGYPTIARTAVPPDELVRVGTYDGHTLDITDRAALAEYLDVDVADLHRELERT